MGAEARLVFLVRGLERTGFLQMLREAGGGGEGVRQKSVSRGIPGRGHSKRNAPVLPVVAGVLG